MTETQPPTLKHQARAMYLAEQPLSQIAVLLGVNLATVRQWAVRGKWREPKRAVQKAVTEIVSHHVIKAIAKDSEDARTIMSNELIGQARILASKPAKTLAELRTTPDRQGRTALSKSLVEAMDGLYGWKNSAVSQSTTQFTDWADSIEVEEVKPSVPLLPEAPKEVS